MTMNLWLLFPKNTVSRGAMPKAELIQRIQFVQSKGLHLLLRDNDEFEVMGLSRENWRQSTVLLKQVFPEAIRYQRV